MKKMPLIPAAMAGYGSAAEPGGVARIGQPIIGKICGLDAFQQLSAAIVQHRPARAEVSGLAGSAGAFVAAALFEQSPRTTLIFAVNGDAATRWYDDLAALLGPERVYRFPTWELSPYEFRRPAAEPVGQRIECLWALAQPRPVVVVTHLRAALELTVPPEELRDKTVSLMVGQDIDIEDIITRLVDLGYERCSLVEEAGSFARRGGIIDVFTYSSEHPVRIELFGDTIESIRTFSVSSQRSVTQLADCLILPSREVLTDRHELAARLAAVRANTALCERVEGDPDFPGLEWLAASLGIPRATVMDHLPAEARVWTDDPEGFQYKTESILGNVRKFHSRTERNYSPIPGPDSIGQTITALPAKAAHFSGVRQHYLRFPDALDFSTIEPPAFASHIGRLTEFLERQEQAARATWILCDAKPHVQRLQEILAAEGGTGLHTTLAAPGVHGGFCFADGDCVLTDHQIFNRHYKQYRRRRFKEGVALSSYNQLSKGDYVVHIDYGIGRFRGLQRITVQGQQRDCLLIHYQNDDKLYVPIEEFNRVQKFTGKEGNPTLTKLGGTTWEKAKRKTKKALLEMATGLVRLYAERKTRPGFVFSPDAEWQKQLEASFAYEETPDQLKAINQIKNDMMGPAPTDRLVCGDVGYGKTEVAIRAAFKAVVDHKQVAVLVPTTILAEQHLNTFRERLAEFPLKIEMLSRFRTAREQKNTIAELAAGRVDIIIGTHRLLSKDVGFANLGLLVVDEEQHFGVAHKEKIRQLKTQVDTVTLTATPIPRTLQMSLLGARDMSLIATSPKDRLPIHTEIREFSPEVIIEAARQELERGGQIFFVHNRVRSIAAMANFLRRILPEMTVGVAHGQMKERELESIMVDFLHRKFDCLLSTAIIESGLDIPSVNTIIINRADRFGLAQLYQLRGRVGRSHVKAYAYLLTPAFSGLTPVARKRLKALEEHTALGSGFHLAMRDLEIRGAGNLLGPQQHGYIEEVGFDLYCRLLEEAVNEIRGEQPAPERSTTKIDYPGETFIPEHYIPDNQQRFEVYKRLADIQTTHELDDLRLELADRFGAPPEAVQVLLDLAYARVLGTGSQVKKAAVEKHTGIITIEFMPERPVQRTEIERWRRGIAEGLSFSPGPPFVLRIIPAKSAGPLPRPATVLKNALEKI
jgi:transcription-repair coupling factor (superfamily II helicase)